MALTLMIDGIASRYGRLPSEVIATGNTFDLFVYDTSVSYVNKVQNGDKVNQYSQEDLLAMVKESRGE